MSLTIVNDCPGLDLYVAVMNLPDSAQTPFGGAESIATPALPTSPSDRGESESIPICVGRSNATDNPV